MNKEKLKRIEQREMFAAIHVCQIAVTRAKMDASIDADAATVAILVQALELATPDLSSERRASLFLHQEN